MGVGKEEGQEPEVAVGEGSRVSCDVGDQPGVAVAWEGRKARWVFLVMFGETGRQEG